MMTARDPHRFVNELDDTAINRLIDRLESRARDGVFTRLVDKYTEKLLAANPARVLEVGCGTGAMIRSFARCREFTGKAVGVDQSQQFLDAAGNFASQENLEGKLEFQLGDAHHLDFPNACFDVVIANTLISHVTEPTKVLREMARVVREGGILAIFDGDYASLTYAHPDHEFGVRMDQSLAVASFNNPRIMRDLPAIIGRYGLKLHSAWGDAVVEIGKGSYFKSFAETYAPYVVNAGLMTSQEVDGWLSAQRDAMDRGTFFACCNYYAYLMHSS
ncbi:MAG: methyltransferase domain-containing protein [Candidatus Thiodiazotropha sp.]